MSRVRGVLIAGGAVAMAVVALVVAVGVPVPRSVFDPASLLPAGMNETHASIWYRPLSRSVVVRNLMLREGRRVVATASRVALDGYRRDGAVVRVRAGELRDLHWVEEDGFDLTVASGHLQGLVAPVSLGNAAGWRAWAEGLIWRRAGLDQAKVQIPHASLAVNSLDVADYHEGAIGRASVAQAAFGVMANKNVAFELKVGTIDIQDERPFWLQTRRFYTEDAGILREALHPGQPNRLVATQISEQIGLVLLRVARLAGATQYDNAGNLRGDSTITGGVAEATTPRTAAALRETIGQDQVQFAGEFAAAFDRAQDQWTLGPARIVASGLGTLTFSLAEQIIPSELQAGTMKGEVLQNAQLQWRDQGLTDRLLAAGAKRRQISLDQMREGAEQAARGMGGLLPGQADFANQLVSFIDIPGTLAITIDPPVPMEFAALAGVKRQDLPGVLGLTVSYKGPP
jgi:hypothetical protein